MVSSSYSKQQDGVGADVRKSYGSLRPVLEVPNLVQVQLSSFRWFQEQGLKELFHDISPIQDFTSTRLDLRFLSYEFRQPQWSEAECRVRNLTHAARLYVRAQLLIKETGEIKEQEIFFGDFPIMTPKGTFITSGAERVVISQLLRSPGVYLTVEDDPTTGRQLCMGKLIPDRGAWLEFETSNRDVISVKVDGKRKIPVTTLLRAIGYETDEQLRALFPAKDVGNNPDHPFIQATIDWQNLEMTRSGGEEDKIDDGEKAVKYIFRRLRPGEPSNLENARGLIKNLLFFPRRYDLGRVGRYKLNQKLGQDLLSLRKVKSREEVARMPREEREALLREHFSQRVLSPEDLVAIVRHVIRVNNGLEPPDDIDHLGNRRVRTVGELIQNQFRVGLLRMERVVKERMSIIDPKTATPTTLINIRPVVAALREFFGGSQLSQFMDQTNPLAELTHKRRLSALGPGGLSR